MKISLIDGEEITSQLAQPGHDTNEDQALELVRALKSKCDDIVINQARFRMPSGENYHHYQTIIHHKGQSHAGHGRSADPKIALMKSVCEAIERLVMRNVFMSEGLISSAEGHINNLGEIHDLGPSQLKVPSVGLRSSNGWAVGTSVMQATQRAFLEAYERHVLQMSYWRTGGGFLTKVKEVPFEDYIVHLFKVPGLAPNVTVVVAAAENPDYSGLAFGHQASFGETLAFDHVIIEAIQNAEGYRLTKGRSPDTELDRVQHMFMEDSELSSSRLEGRGENKLEWPSKINVAAVDLTKLFDISFPLKCCWVSSRELLPLYLVNRLTPPEREAMELHCSKLGLRGPFQQTPFI